MLRSPALERLKQKHREFKSGPYWFVQDSHTVMMSKFFPGRLIHILPFTSLPPSPSFSPHPSFLPLSFTTAFLLMCIMHFNKCFKESHWTMLQKYNQLSTTEWLNHSILDKTSGETWFYSFQRPTSTSTPSSLFSSLSTFKASWRTGPLSSWITKWLCSILGPHSEGWGESHIFWLQLMFWVLDASWL